MSTFGILRWTALGAACVAFGAACVTPYQPQGLGGGYDDRRLGPTLFFVKIKGNGFTGETTLVEYFHRRATEICQSIGFAYYTFDSSTAANTTRAPSSYSASTTYSPYGSRTEVQENPRMTVTRYEVTGYVNCHTPMQQYVPPQPSQYPTYSPTPPPGAPPAQPVTMANAIALCKQVSRDTSIAVGCETDYIAGEPSMIMAFRNPQDANGLLGAMAQHVAGPFCQAANSANRSANVYLVLSGRQARRFSCEMGTWGEWFELNADDQKQFPSGTQSL